MPGPYVTVTPSASGTPYDNSTTGLGTGDTQSAIDALNTKASVSASPGFSFGRSGTVTPGTYLLVDSVPSNVAGRIVPLSSGFITDVFFSCGVSGTFTLLIQTRSGSTFTTIYTLTVTAARTLTVSGLSIAVTQGQELAVAVGTGNPQNVVMGLIVKGSI